MMQTKERYIKIDIMKFVFAFFVMVYHINMNLNVTNQWSAIIAWVVGIAVPYYYVASGFFLFRKISDGTEKNKISVMWNYGKHIFLMYISWTLLMLPFRLPDAIHIGFHIREQFIYWAKYIRVVLFIGEYQLWYLIGLLWAVALFALCYRKNKLRYSVVVMLVLYLLKILIEQFPDFMNSSAIFRMGYHIYYLFFGTTRNGFFIGFIYLIIGVLFAKYKERIKQLRKTGGGLEIGIYFVIVLIGYGISIRGLHVLGQLLQTMIVTLTFYLTFSAAQKKEESLATASKSKLLRDIGTIVYLSHSAMILLADEVLQIHNKPAFYLVVVSLATGLAFLIIHKTEKVKWLRKLY